MGEVAVTGVQVKINMSDTFSRQKSFNNIRMGKERRQKSIDSQRVKSGPSALCGGPVLDQQGGRGGEGQSRHTSG